MRTKAVRLVAGVAIVLAAAAGAASAGRYVGDDKITIHTSGADFDGTLDWWTDGGEVEPVLTGILELDRSAGTCARVRMDLQTSAGALVLTRTGHEVCAGDNAKHSYSVDLGYYSSIKVGKVKAVVERRNSNGKFTTIGSETNALPALAESFTITARGLDFGGGDFAAGVPTNRGSLYWNLEAGKFTPKLYGTLHIDNAAGACGRVRLTYLDSDGTALARETGSTKCASDNGHREFAIHFGPFSDSRIAKVKVTLQSIPTNGDAIGLGSRTFVYGTVKR